MVHNGIEYGLMQAYAEGYELLQTKDIVTDVPGTLKAWTRGTVVRSWLLELLVKALEADPALSSIDDFVEDSGEGRWTVDEAIDAAVPLPVISAALFARFSSRQEPSPGDAGRRRAAPAVRRARRPRVGRPAAAGRYRRGPAGRRRLTHLGGAAAFARQQARAPSDPRAPCTSPTCR